MDRLTARQTSRLIELLKAANNTYIKFEKLLSVTRVTTPVLPEGVLKRKQSCPSIVLQNIGSPMTLPPAIVAKYRSPLKKIPHTGNTEYLNRCG